MTRHVVAIESHLYADGRMIQAGALICEDERIPVTMAYNHQYLWGVATDMQRDEQTGEVSFEIELNPELEFNPKMFEYAVSLKPFKMEKAGDCFLITWGRIREVSAAPLPGFPKDVFNKGV